MEFAVTIVAIVATVTLVAALASRAGVPEPLALIVVGVAGSYLPFISEPELSPEVVLLGLLPPLLYAAALRTSLVDFRANRGPIISLSVGLVLATAFAVGLVAWWLLPIPFAVAFALGAIVAPPDAVAATSIARRMGLPRGIVTILEGESLINDATALVSLRTAIGAFSVAGVAAAEVSFGRVALEFVWAVVGGVAIGVLVALVVTKVRRLFDAAVLDTALSFMAPFLAYLPAEHVGASGVLAVVVAGLLIGHKAPLLQSASSRLSERINWATVQFLLENAVFLMIGLQMRRIVSDVTASDIGVGQIAVAVLAVLATVLVVRPLWVFPAGWLMRRTRLLDRETPFTHSAIVSWAGMRGVVTLAAALSLPRDLEHRDVLVFAAMVITVATLLAQGTTLPWLARRLGVRGPDPQEDALQEASVMQSAIRAGLSKLDECSDADAATVQTMRERAEKRTNIIWERLGGLGRELLEETPTEAYRRLRLIGLTAERAEVLRLRDTGTVDQEIISHVLAQLDIEESMIERVQERTSVLRETPLLPVARPGGDCEDLREDFHQVAPNTPDGCGDCLRDSMTWVHLRLCLDCGNVGCCDSSAGRHAEAHFQEAGHPVMRSFEPGEAWRWCYVHELLG